MPYAKGQGGRPPGAKNKLTEEVRELARALFTKDYWKRKKQQLDAGTLPPQLEAKLLAYAYGEPKQEHTLNTGIVVNIGYLGTSPQPPQLTIDAEPISVPQIDSPLALPPAREPDAG